MRVWRVFLGEECDWIQPSPEWSVDEKRTFDGRPKKESWNSSRTVLLASGGISHESNFYKLSGVAGVVTDQEGYKVLRSLIVNEAEFLSLEYENKSIFYINVTNIVDCLDYDDSVVKYFDNTSDVMDVKKYAFMRSALDGVLIFRLKELPYYGPFVTDRFVDIYKRTKLKGLDFELVWDSDGKGECLPAEEVVIEDELPQRSFFPYAEELDSAVADEVHEASAAETRHLGVGRMAKPADAAKAIEERVRSLIDSTEDAPQVERNELDESIELGALFGDILCGQYGWKWKKVGYDQEDSAHAVCSPRDCYCVLPFQFIQKILSGENIGPGGTNDNTVMLLFNMLASIEESVPEKLLTPLG